MIRLFVAVDLPQAIRRSLARWGRGAVGEDEGMRLIAPAHLHVTLCFLGWREEEEAAALGERVSGCAAPAPGLALGAAAWLPARRPRVLAVDLEDSARALTGLQRRVSDALEAAGAYVPERRPYRPHVTVARVRGRARVRARELSPPPARTFAAEALTLYRSRLERGGARYEPLARAGL